MKPIKFLKQILLGMSLPFSDFSDNTSKRDSGLQNVYEQTDAFVDIVAVHGLDGDWKGSWTAKNGVFWLKDLLPDEIPRSRILSYAYDSRWNAETLLNQDIFYFGSALVRELTELRIQTHTLERPIIFIGHSLGGIVVKTALGYSYITDIEHHRNVVLSTRAVLFMGTPHRGSDFIKYLERLAGVFSRWKDINDALLNHLETNSGVLDEIQFRYTALQKTISTYYFYESREMSISLGLDVLLVPKHAAIVEGTPNAERIMMDADHTTIVKYDGPKDPNFHHIMNPIRRLSNSMVPKHIAKLTDYPQFEIGSIVKKPRNEKFIGRVDLMDSIINRLLIERDMKRQVLVLYGPGGVGKTQLILEYIYRQANDYTSIIWLDATSKDSLIRSIIKSLQDLKYHYESLGIVKNYFYSSLANAVENGTNFTETLHHWLSNKNNLHWLIVMDNLDDLDSFNFRDFLPTTNWGTIIITSRRSDLRLQYEAIQVLPMSQAEALKLLEEKSKIEINESSREYYDAQMLLSDLGYFPLAVSHAGSFIAMEHMTDPNPIQRYRAILADEDSGGPRILFDSPIMHNAEYDKGLFTSWEISFNSVKRQNADAVYILHRIAFLDKNSITESLFTCGSDFWLSRERFRNAIRLLISYSIVDLSKNDYEADIYRYYSVHPLVQSWAMEQLSPKQRLEILKEVAMMIYKLHLSKATGHSDECHHNTKVLWSNLDAVFANCERYLGETPVYSPPPGESFAIFPFREAYHWYLWVHVKIKDGVVFMYQSVTGTEITGFQIWEIIHALRRERYTKGESHVLRWVFKQAMDAYPLRHPRILNVAEDYAAALCKKQMLSEAESWYSWLLDSRRAVLGHEHPATMGALMGIGRVFLENHDCDNALVFLKTAAETREKILGPSDYLTENAQGFLRDAAKKCVKYESSHCWQTNDREMSGSEIVEICVQVEQTSTGAAQIALKHDIYAYLPMEDIHKVATGLLLLGFISEGLKWSKEFLLWNSEIGTNYRLKTSILETIWDTYPRIQPDHLSDLWETISASREFEVRYFKTKLAEQQSHFSGLPGKAQYRPTLSVYQAATYIHAVTVSLALVDMSLGKNKLALNHLKEYHFVPPRHGHRQFQVTYIGDYSRIEPYDYSCYWFILPHHAYHFYHYRESWWLLKQLT